jgi:YegS/Rv2252/BmrU family lipid kinase
MFRKQDHDITPYSRAVLIYNPRAGQLKNGGAQRLDRAAELLRSFGHNVAMVQTDGPRSAGTLAANAIRAGCDLIIAAGGDGTISEVIDGMANSHVPLAVLPAGTANVLAHEVGLSRDLAAAARQIQTCTAERVPLGRIETGTGPRHFLLMAGAGFDAQIIQGLDMWWKDRLGKLSYFLAGVGHLGQRLPELEVVIDWQAHRCTFALISKVRNYGGDFEIASEVSLQDDSFEVVLFEDPNSWRYLGYLAGVVTRRLAQDPGVTFSRASSVGLRAVGGEQVYLQADGELIGSLPATITMVPDALTILLPAGALDRVPPASSETSIESGQLR